MDSRREFLKKILAVSVLSVACPHDILAQMLPNEIKDTGNKITGLYTLDISSSKFDALKTIWGAIILDPITAHDGSYQVLEITRLDYNVYKHDYAAMNTRCPHRGQIVGLLNPEKKLIRCPLHGSLFNPDGSLYYSETTNLSLERYSLTNDGDKTLYIELYFYVSAEDNPNVSTISSITRVFPNPTRDLLLIDYFVAYAGVTELSVFDLNGTKVTTLSSDYQTVGIHDLKADLSYLPAGSYFIRLASKNGDQSSKKFEIVK
jgi:nitrite reductase/ring-hydroxylating ferredoxin subunit